MQEGEECIQGMQSDGEIGRKEEEEWLSVSESHAHCVCACVDILAGFALERVPQYVCPGESVGPSVPLFHTAVAHTPLFPEQASSHSPEKKRERLQAEFCKKYPLYTT